MKAIFKKDFLSYFRNVVGWLFIGVVLLFFGIYFTLYNILQSAGNVNYPISTLTLIFTLVVPLLTMRSFAEERKNKTDQLLFTAPVSVSKIVFGKYLALALIVLIVSGVFCIAPFIMHFYGDISYAENYLSIFGFLLFGLTAVAIGLFISSLFENVIIAAIVTYVVLLLGLLMSNLIDSFNSDNIFASLISNFDLIKPFDDFLNGIFSIRGVIYYASIIALCLFLTMQVINKRRFTISKKTFSISAFSIGGIIAAFAIVILANFIMTKVPDKYTEADLTQNKLYKLSSDTKKYLKSYKTDTTIYVYGTKSSLNEVENKTIKQFTEANKHIKSKYIDPSTNPTFISAYTSDSLQTGSLIVVNTSGSDSNTSDSVSNDKYKVVSYEDIFESSFDYSSYSSYISAYDGEGEIISALNYVSSEDKPKIYELTGDSEYALEKTFTGAISKLNISDESLNLLSTDSVPEDCDLLIIHAPQSDLSMNSIEKIKSYIDNGGRVMIDFELLSASSLTNLKSMLSDYGITVLDGTVCEMDQNYYYNSQFELLPEVETGDIGKGIDTNMSIYAPYSVGLKYDENSDNTFTPILKTSDTAIVKPSYTDVDSLQEATYNGTIAKEEGDIEGPFYLGLREDTTSKGQITVFGSAYMFSENNGAMFSTKNVTLFSQAVATAIPDTVDSVSIPSKSIEGASILVSSLFARIYFIFCVWVIPIALIIFGVVVWAVRRKF